METGVFPLGPAPAMQAELYRREQVIRELVKLLNRIRYQVGTIAGHDLDAERKFWRSLHTGKCIICGRDRGDPTNDLDTVFCSQHCTACGGPESLLEVRDGV